MYLKKQVRYSINQFERLFHRILNIHFRPMMEKAATFSETPFIGAADML